MFVIDSSSSITPENYTIAKNFIRSFSEKLNTTVNNSIGIILIGDNALVWQHLGVILTEENRNEILQNVNATPLLPLQLTNIADGLCKLTNQAWCNDSGVLQVAVVLTDGHSSAISDDPECQGATTESMAEQIRENYTHILVFAVGIGNMVNMKELSLIASRSHLVTTLGQYHMLNPDTLHYQVCSTCKPMYR